MGRLQVVLSQNIKRARLRLNYSQVRLAELCGVSPSFIGEIEAGKKAPSWDKLEKLAEALGVKPYQLLFEEEERDVLEAYQNINSLYQELRDKINTGLEETIRKHLFGGS